MALAITNTNIGSGDGSARLVTYDNLDELDTTPGPIALPEWADRSVQVTGTFNGGTLVVEGSNDGTNWYTLNDPQGNALSFTTAKIEQILEAVAFMRPRVSAGAGVDLDVTFFLRRTSGMRT
jgi:hypothetical protein